MRCTVTAGIVAARLGQCWPCCGLVPRLQRSCSNHSVSLQYSAETGAGMRSCSRCHCTIMRVGSFVECVATARLQLLGSNTGNYDKESTNKVWETWLPGADNHKGSRQQILWAHVKRQGLNHAYSTFHWAPKYCEGSLRRTGQNCQLAHVLG